jgi:hypothetical protein
MAHAGTVQLDVMKTYSNPAALKESRASSAECSSSALSDSSAKCSPSGSEQLSSGPESSGAISVSNALEAEQKPLPVFGCTLPATSWLDPTGSIDLTRPAHDLPPLVPLLGAEEAAAFTSMKPGQFIAQYKVGTEGALNAPCV